MTRMTNFRLAASVAAGLLAGGAGAAEAGDWGAIAFSSRTGAHGYSYSHNSRASAERTALSHCRRHGGGCRIVVYFARACGALAVGEEYGAGWAWDRSRRQAEHRALAYCDRHADECEIVRSICSG
jgi:hypothetical protein